MSGHVLVVGAINVDLVVIAPRLPGPGETVVGSELQRFGGGKGGNAAVAAARAGASVRMIGAVGDDEFGSMAVAELRSEGVDVTDVLRKVESSTGAALIVVDAVGENQIAVAAGANAEITANDVSFAMGRVTTHPGCVLVSTEIAPAGVVSAVRTAAASGWRSVLNPAPVIDCLVELLDLAPVLTPNRGELADLCRLLDESDAGSIDVMAAAVASHTQASVVVTLGADGVLCCDRDGLCTSIPAFAPREVVDTTGAGDTFNGVLAAGIAAGLPILEAAARGVTAAGLSVEAAGARAGMPLAASISARDVTTRDHHTRSAPGAAAAARTLVRKVTPS